MEKNKTILIVEDEELINRALSEGFKRRGYHVLSAADGEAGWRHIQSDKPDIILLDLILPKMSGQEVLEKMNETGLIERIPVLVLTNVSDGSTLKQCTELGAREYVIKANFTFEQMEKIISKHLED